MSKQGVFCYSANVSARPLTFVVFDDDEDGAFLTEHSLKLEFPDSRVSVFFKAVDGLAFIAQGTPVDAVITDNSMPDINGLTVIKRLRDSQCKFPIVMLTGRSDLEHSALAAGADLFISNLDTGALPRALRKLLGPGSGAAGH